MLTRTTDDVQLDLMEKDIVIEQLRTQLKQLRSRIAVMEEDQATDTAPLQELLNQLGELKVRVGTDRHRALLVSPLPALHMSCFFFLSRYVAFSRLIIALR